MENIDIFFKNKTNLVKGKKQLIRFINEGKIKKVLLAEDNDSFFINEITTICSNANVEFKIALTKSHIGKLCNIDVPCGVVGIMQN